MPKLGSGAPLASRRLTAKPGAQSGRAPAQTGPLPIVTIFPSSWRATAALEEPTVGAEPGAAVGRAAQARIAIASGISPRPIRVTYPATAFGTQFQHGVAVPCVDRDRFDHAEGEDL